MLRRTLVFGHGTSMLFSSTTSSHCLGRRRSASMYCATARRMSGGQVEMPTLRQGSTASASSAVTLVAGYKSRNHSQISVPESQRELLATTVENVFNASQPRERSAQLRDRIQLLKKELEPLLTVKKDIDARAKRYPMIFLLGNFAFLSAQFAVLFNWVFFTFDWNLVEPITYFLGYSVVWMGVMFYNATGREFTYDATIEVLEERKKAKLYKTLSFDAAKFGSLEAQLKEAEVELEALS